MKTSGLSKTILNDDNLRNTCNSAPRALPVRSKCPTFNHHWNKARRQSKKVVGNSLETLTMTEKRSTDFWGSPNGAACPLPNYCAEIFTIQKVFYSVSLIHMKFTFCEFMLADNRRPLDIQEKPITEEIVN